VHLSYWLLGLTLLWLAGCVPIAPPTSADPWQLLAADCPLRIPDELEEGQTIHCGYLRLPQDRSDPTGPHVEIPYAHIRAESAHPAADPVLFVAGGPGGSALAEFDEVYAWLRPLRRDRDLILYDQRGTLLARPVLACDQAADALAPDAAALAQAEAQLPLQLRPLDANDLDVVACAQELQAQGIDLAAYDTATHAQDLLDLGRALGYPRFNLLGVSYGTRIALEAMRTAPLSVRAVVLDSLLPPEVAAYEAQNALTSVAVLHAVLDDCAADGACAAAYPDVADRFAQLPTHLAADPLALPTPWPASFDEVAWWEFMLTRMTPATLPYLPRLVVELEKGEAATLVGLLSGSLPAQAPQVVGASLVEEPSAAVLDFVLRLNAAYFLSDAARDPAAQAAWRLMAARHAERARLEEFIEIHLAAYVAEDERAVLLAQLAQLTDAELDVVCSELAGAPSHPITVVANLAVECRDEQPFNDYATAVTAHRQWNIPDAVTATALERLRHFWAQCALWPAPAAPIAQTQPVTSPLPTLALQGAWDGVTPAAWSDAAMQYLPNAQSLRFPGAGHVVLAQPVSLASGCPAQLIRRFLDAPTQPLDTACIDTHYSVAWAMPAE
jgi:pimeloyl-ACP methyl ester carboxylesterase